MKTFTSLFLFFLLFSGLLFSCNRHADYQSFLIQVDSLQMPGIIHPNEPFDIALFGIIGSDGCSRFSQFSTSEQGNNIIIEAWGERETHASACPAVMVFLNNEKLTYTLKEKGAYTLKVRQPNGSYLEHYFSID